MWYQSLLYSGSEAAFPFTDTVSATDVMTPERLESLYTNFSAYFCVRLYLLFITADGDDLSDVSFKLFSGAEI